MLTCSCPVPPQSRWRLVRSGPACKFWRTPRSFRRSNAAGSPWPCFTNRGNSPMPLGLGNPRSCSGSSGGGWDSGLAAQVDPIPGRTNAKTARQAAWIRILIFIAFMVIFCYAFVSLRGSLIFLFGLFNDLCGLNCHRTEQARRKQFLFALVILVNVRPSEAFFGRQRAVTDEAVGPQVDDVDLQRIGSGLDGIAPGQPGKVWSRGCREICRSHGLPPSCSDRPGRG